MTEVASEQPPHSLVRRIGLPLAYAAGFSPVAMLLGPAMASHEGTFGANEASYSVDIRPDSETDLGPVGQIMVDETFGPFSSVPVLKDVPGLKDIKPYGVTATVHGIPATNDDSTAAIGDIINSYAFEVENLDTHKEIIRDELVADAEKKMLYLELGWMAAVGLGAVMLRPDIRRRLGPLATTGIGLCVLAGTMSAADYQRPIEGIVITVPRIGEVRTSSMPIDYIVSTILPTMENFLDRKEKQRTAFVSTVNAQLDAQTGLMQEREEGDRLLFSYADLHCSFAMARVLKHAVGIYQPDAVTMEGDPTTNGTEVEQVCVDKVEEIFPDTAVIYGNHESGISEKQLKDSGMHYLHETMVTVGGFTILGGGDPERTPAGASGPEARVSRNGLTEEEAGQRLAEISKEKRPNIVIVHQPAERDAFLAAGGVADMIFNGHTHQVEPPRTVEAEAGDITVIQDGTAGGIGEQGFDNLNTPLSLPSKDATVQAFRVSALGAVYRQLITVAKTGEVTVSPWTLIPGAQITISETAEDLGETKPTKSTS